MKTENKPAQPQTLQKSFQRLALTGRSSVCGDEFSSLGETGMTPANSYSLLYTQLATSQVFPQISRDGTSDAVLKSPETAFPVRQMQARRPSTCQLWGAPNSRSCLHPAGKGTARRNSEGRTKRIKPEFIKKVYINCLKASLWITV